eukprot:Polyplicarium_translucidae@DN1874_c0_g1_i1.p3
MVIVYDTPMPAHPPPARGTPPPRQLAAGDMEELREAFNLFDSDHSGNVDVRELRAAMRAMGFDASKDEMSAVLYELGKTPHDAFTFDEFMDLMSRRLRPKGSREEAARTFSLFDADGTGRVGLRTLRAAARQLGESYTDDDLREMIEEADRDGDGFVDAEDFYRIIRRATDPLYDSEEDE